MGDQLLWYTARGAGAVSLVLLSAVVVLGLVVRGGVQPRSWPRFLGMALHNDLALLALAFLSLHIVTAVVDPFTHLGLTPVFIPFGSDYRTVWLGLGTIAFELLLAIVLTSLLRRHFREGVWRAVHWLAYCCWPLAVLHELGTGTDAFSVWLIGVTTVCFTAVAFAAITRWSSVRDPLAARRRASAQRATARGTR